jgi:hypothetical protein
MLLCSQRKTGDHAFCDTTRLGESRLDVLEMDRRDRLGLTRIGLRFAKPQKGGQPLVHFDRESFLSHGPTESLLDSRHLLIDGDVLRLARTGGGAGLKSGRHRTRTCDFDRVRIAL